MQQQENFKLGLALGSGAARGWALIGALKSLHKLGIQPKVIAGCSMGSLVGAAYCTDKLDELEKWALSLDTWKVVRLLDWGMGRGGVVSGTKLYKRLESQIGNTLIEDSSVQYAAVATELYTGREHIFQQGSYIDAVRASCAIPGMLAPQFIDGHWMIDGAVVNPVPVSVCRAMGATHVIAIDLNCGRVPAVHKKGDIAAPAHLKNLPNDIDEANEAGEIDEQEQPNKFQDLLGQSKGFIDQLINKIPVGSANSPSMVAVATSAIDIMQNRITRSRLAADPPDLLIQPKVEDIGILEFNRAAEAIKLGEDAVMKVAHLLDEFKEAQDD
ncbi:patatin-like phospholipase RssA [Catenovulum sediminis]|uniref:Patatin-like phospholipase RssA n=1 Tax=Catenovulum sediminis TaxID=1740262 RepID=A0ABV1RHQ3_9ALTE|nr:patatin-like phospholipase RssA [Catenovulum sediminis]